MLLSFQHNVRRAGSAFFIESDVFGAECFKLIWSDADFMLALISSLNLASLVHNVFCLFCAKDVRPVPCFIHVISCIWSARSACLVTLKDLYPEPDLFKLTLTIWCLRPACLTWSNVIRARPACLTWSNVFRARSACLMWSNVFRAGPRSSKCAMPRRMRARIIFHKSGSTDMRPAFRRNHHAECACRSPVGAYSG